LIDHQKPFFLLLAAGVELFLLIAAAPGACSSITAAAKLQEFHRDASFSCLSRADAAAAAAAAREQ